MGREIVLTQEEFKQIPGHSTRLSVARIQGMVKTLLTEHGVQDMAWITRGGEEELLFQMDIEILGVSKKIAYQFRPPIIVVKKRKSGGKSSWILQQKPAASWRVFHDLLQRTLAASKLGIMPVHHVLMAFITKELPDGTQGTFGDFMDMVIAKDRLTTLGLEDLRKVKVVDSTVVEK